MKRFLVLSLLFLGLASTGQSAPPGAKPQPGAPPQPATITPPLPALPEVVYIETLSPKSSTLRTFVALITYKAVPKTVEEKVPVQVQEKVVVNGMEMIVTKTVYQTVVKTMTVSVPELAKVIKEWNVTDSLAVDVAGNKLSKDEVFKRLQPGMAVLVMPTGQKLHPAHERLFNKNTVILTPTVQP